MKVSFAVISDIHIKSKSDEDDKKFKRALVVMNKLRPELDAVLIAGDITHRGKAAEYSKFREIYRRYGNPQSEKVFVMGNHDYWNGLPISFAQKRFEKSTGTSIHTHKVIKGFHFISVSTEGRRRDGYFSPKLILWVKDRLEAAKKDNPHKPIFFTVHQHIANTVYGSEEWSSRAFYDVLKDYPQVVTFTGHSHHPLNDPRSIHQRDFTSVGTASVSYVEMESGKINGSVPPRAEEFSQGLLVNVDENNRVTINPVDFAKGKVLDKEWTIEDINDKSKFKYTDDRYLSGIRPYFSKKNVKLQEVTPNSVTVTFDKGKHEEFIHSYKIQIIDNITGKLHKEFLAFSDFYLSKSRKKLTLKLSGLMKNTKYRLKIKAVEPFGKESEDYLSASFKTKDKSVIKTIKDNLILLMGYLFTPLQQE
ncbi:MAG: metallophosphoesterase [Clostridiaceae bacterium]